jgi:hypothetical protein
VIFKAYDSPKFKLNMLKRFLSVFIVLSLCMGLTSRADEGMWLPMLIKRLNHADMQKKGLKLTAEELYSVNTSSLKDAIVNFGNFCTGEVISKEGLVLTNHHCGFDAIQSHSSVEHDYLTDGFWAMKRGEEKYTPGLTVTFLVRMEDVTAQVLGSLTAGMSASEKEDAIGLATAKLEKEAVANTHYQAQIKSFFEGNEYYLFIYEIFRDIRLVGAPPSSIGKFGGDTDNWVWPRHTGDFALFRIYTGPDGKPADYAADNIPYKPKHHLPVSLQGIAKNDFAMVLGYPGGTERYMHSEGVRMALEQDNPIRIKLREKRLTIMKEAMDANPDVRIRYASKYARVSNYYKYFIGQNKGLRKLTVVERKQQEEKQFQQWVEENPERQGMYGNVMSDFDAAYKEYRKVNKPYIYLEEAAFASELLLMAYRSAGFYNVLASKPGTEILEAAKKDWKAKLDKYFKDYDPAIDQKITAALLSIYYQDIPQSLHPSIFKEVEKKYKGDFEKYAAAMFAKSIFASREKMNAFLSKPDPKVYEKDPAVVAMNSILGDFRKNLGGHLGEAKDQLDKVNNLYLHGILEMRKGQKLYPDANFTMRLTYGTVQDCIPGDGVHYNFYTTLEGVMQKEDPNDDEFIVPKKLKELYSKKDYGRYADKNGTLPVCFITNNDITGGNSGSPVINGKGHLIGTAFDGNWEAMSGDIIFEPNLQRCISVDIRYILFIIDKYAGAGHLVREMTVIE